MEEWKINGEHLKGEDNLWNFKQKVSFFIHLVRVVSFPYTCDYNIDLI